MTPAAKRASSRVAILDFLASPPADVPSLVVLVGREHVLADAAIHTIVASAIPDESMRALNVDAVDAATVRDKSELSSRVQALPFLAPRRIVIVRGTIDLKADERAHIVDACRDVPDHAVMIVDHAGRPARAQGRKPKDEAAAMAAGTKRALLLETALDKESALGYVDGIAAALGATIDPGARALLAETEDASEIKNALERLALATKHIRVADIREYAASPQELKLWDLGEAVNARDVRRALAIAHEFDNFVGPLQWLASDAQAIWELSAGARSDEYARVTGLNSWRVSKLTGAARSIAPAAAKRNVDMTMKALELCITGKREPVQTLEEVIIRLCESAK